MAIEDRSISARIHGRYLVRISMNAKEPLLVGFHGYAEDAEAQLERMARIPGSDQWTLCSIQGLHTFYRSGHSKIAASWMTKQNRELAIQDNLEYVAKAIAEVREESSAPVALFGFSQGGAMAYRFAASGLVSCQGLIILGSDLPPDIPDADLAALPPILLARGKNDRFVSSETIESDTKRLRSAGANVRDCVFEGGHDCAEEFLKSATKFLQEIYGM